MKNKTISSYLLAGPGKIDWNLLVFLLLFLNVKLVVKIGAVFLMYILRPNFKFGFRLKNSRLPLFYLLVIGIAIFNWLLSGLTGNFNYALVLATGICFWVLCILAIHQVKLAVEKNDILVIHNTILVFFILNALVSLAVYAGIVWETGATNPYRYQGNYQKYFIGTGDHIKGITFDTSTTNAVINAFAVIYFLQKEKYALTLLCMGVLLLTGSNISNLLLCGALLYIFLFQSSKNQKSIIVVCMLMLITFFTKISPQNNAYVADAWQQFFNKQPKAKKATAVNIPITQMPDSILNDEEKKEKIAQLYMDSINMVLFEKNKVKSGSTLSLTVKTGFIEKPVIPKDSIHTPKFQYKNDTNATKKTLLQFVADNNTVVPIASGKVTKPTLPGKLIAMQQIGDFFKEHPAKIVTGNGIGNFSSKLAFRATSMKVYGNYPARFTYINKGFESNHLDLYLYYFSNKDRYHSIVNSPNSAYGQVLSEYGLAGLMAFVFFYIAFFMRQVKWKTYAIPIILFMLGAFFIEYWFEQLSVVILFELLVLLSIKETTVNNIHETN